MKYAAVIVGFLAAAVTFCSSTGYAATPHRATLIHGAPAHANVPTERWYVTIPGGDEDRLLEIFHELHDRGARRMQCFLPDLLVCDIPVDVDPHTTVGGAGVVMARAEDAASLSGYSLSIEPAAIERGLKQLPEERKRERAAATPASPAFVPTVESESRRIPDDAIQESVRMAAASGNSDFRLIFQNSEILAGTILMQLVLPESDYPEEWQQYQNWSNQAIDDIGLALYYMTNEFQDQYINANIDVVYKWSVRVPIKAEPITYTTGNDKFWIALTMAKLGYPGDETTVLTNVHQFNESARIKTGADWVFTAFIANAEKVTDHRFNNARTLAWHYLGGPYFVTSYPAGHLEGPYDFMIVLKHEFSHIFWGVEEDIGPASTCDTYSGYLNIQNLNKVTAYSPIDQTAKGCPDGQNPVDCIMNELYAFAYYTTTVCNVTTAMFGLSDDNENDVPDALDRPPEIIFENADVETVVVSPEIMRVHVSAVPVPNQNPMQPAELRRSYAAPIQDISVRVGGVPAYTIVPKQIGSDGYEADFEVNLPPLLPGNLDILVDARNEYNSTSPTRVKRYMYVHLKYVTFNIRHPNEGIRLSWEMLGDTFGARFEVLRTCVDTGEEVVVAEGFAPNGPPVNGLTPYAVLDRTAVIGEHYTYRVRGTIDLPYRTSVIHKVVDSVAIPAQGAVPRTHKPESPISNAAPNPFTDKTWISVTIPFVDTPAPGTAQSSTNSESTEEPSTLVHIDVYDVLGRRVARLYQRWVIGSAVTVSWDGTDDGGKRLPSGMYFVRARVGTLSEIRKVLLIH